MTDGIFGIPEPRNEPVLDYAPGSPEREQLKARLRRMAAEPIDIPLVIGGRRVHTGRVEEVRAPHDHRLVLGQAHLAGPDDVTAAIEAAKAARAGWASLPWQERAAVFLRAADLLAGPWRQTLNAATMLGQSKTPHQAEIDSACEVVDYWRFNPHFVEQLYAGQPRSSPGRWNHLEYRPLEGFVFAVTPFNFTAIAANLPTAPAMLGNTVVWKPAATAMLSAHYLLRVLEEAGLPPGVINLVSGPGRPIGDVAFSSADFAGLHFTGSTPTFQSMWRTIADHLSSYRGYPRIVGETGGKGFVFAHPSADLEALAVALVRGAFEYQGQKCSAASRAYVPKSLWPRLRERLREHLAEVKMGDIADFSNFMGAVIDEAAFRKIEGYLAHARGSGDYRLVAGGRADSADGWFIEPTIFETSDPRGRLMAEEVFGPVLTIYPYADDRLEEALALCDSGSPYALTGAVFARDRTALHLMNQSLSGAAGNFYVNDKPTGAVVGQQPFGGSRASGTNDKAGSAANLMRWVSLRTVAETFVPPTEWDYPYLQPERAAAPTREEDVRRSGGAEAPVTQGAGAPAVDPSALS